jgi:hypothetical protein
VIPLSFHDFFSGCATIAGALIGLLFVVLSVSSESLRGEHARTDHQVRAGAAFSALVNTLMPPRRRTRRIPALAMPLIERDDSVLVVIDLQPRFWGDRLDAEDRQCAADGAARAAWLAAAATAWRIPAVVTEEAHPAVAPAHRRSFMPSCVAAKPSLP